LLTVIDVFCTKLLFYCTQLRFVQLSNKAYDDDDDDDDDDDGMAYHCGHFHYN